MKNLEHNVGSSNYHQLRIQPLHMYLNLDWDTITKDIAKYLTRAKPGPEGVDVKAEDLEKALHSLEIAQENRQRVDSDFEATPFGEQFDSHSDACPWIERTLMARSKYVATHVRIQRTLTLTGAQLLRDFSFQFDYGQFVEDALRCCMEGNYAEAITHVQRIKKERGNLAQMCAEGAESFGQQTPR